MNEHWLDKALREHRLLNLEGHVNRPRMDANTIHDLIMWRNEMLGVKRTLYEESVIADEKGEEPMG